MKDHFPYAAEKTSQRRNEAAKRLECNEFMKMITVAYVMVTSVIGNLALLYVIVRWWFD